MSQRGLVEEAFSTLGSPDWADPSAEGWADTQSKICLMPTFDLIGGSAIGSTGSRLLALLVLEHGRLSRGMAASTLWPGTSDKRASANLRTTLWRINSASPRLIDGNTSSLELAPNWGSDLNEAQRLARLLTAPADLQTWVPPAEEVPSIVATLSTDLLTDWYDDWALDHRERWRQLRLHALESLGSQLIQRNSSALAIEAVGVAVSIEPLRESAHRVLISAHLSDGNLSEALQVHRRYRDRLHRELGVEPSPHMTALMAEAFGP